MQWRIDYELQNGCLSRLLFWILPQIRTYHKKMRKLTVFEVGNLEYHVIKRSAAFYEHFVLFSPKKRVKKPLSSFQ